MKALACRTVKGSRPRSKNPVVPLLITLPVRPGMSQLRSNTNQLQRSASDANLGLGRTDAGAAMLKAKVQFIAVLLIAGLFAWACGAAAAAVRIEGQVQRRGWPNRKIQRDPLGRDWE